ncbi:MAG: aminopeptidase [Candidatus Wenzhouxiangella sp. M2_3B_020]
MAALLFGAFAVLSGCATLGWYGQAARGQAELLLKRKDIEKVLDSPELSAIERERLRAVEPILAFAERRLALPADGSYEAFVDLDRDAVVYNVVAAPEFSVEPKTWCYPIAGCVAYRGYFRREAARRRADRLARRGFDVVVAPAVAYSTLGRLDDPVTSPMLGYRVERLAGLLFHELAHQRVYVSGDTAFNEAYATFVERAGVAAWLRARGDADRLERWLEEQRLERAFTRLLLDARQRLAELYAEDRPASETRAAKQAAFCRLRAEIRAFAASHRSGRFEAWTEVELDNARLALVASYEAGTDAFADLLAEYGGNFERFHQAVERLASEAGKTRAEFLNRCRTNACP